jgi:hypothetical protein
VLEAVGPSLVEKVQVPESLMVPTCREWDKASGSDVKGFGVRRPGTFWQGDMRFIVTPRWAYPIRVAYPQPDAPVCHLVPGGGHRPRVPNSIVRTFVGSASDRWPPPFLLV